jgi:hypothetical protein
LSFGLGKYVAHKEDEEEDEVENVCLSFGLG